MADQAPDNKNAYVIKKDTLKAANKFQSKVEAMTVSPDGCAKFTNSEANIVLDLNAMFSQQMIIITVGEGGVIAQIGSVAVRGLTPYSE